MAGLLTYPRKATFPSLHPDSGVRRFSTHRVHSSGHCSGFQPDSLLNSKEKYCITIIGCKDI